ncbi:hypothetical protein HK102_007773 [Quaeritorhiza haematococci]|nr:hypothetical protein HK102_007773 [Quaeritorhiza haematococci]
MKREADNYLTSENYHEEENTNPSDPGSFKTASVDELKRRTIKKPISRLAASSNTGAPKPTFSGFSFGTATATSSDSTSKASFSFGVPTAPAGSPKETPAAPTFSFTNKSTTETTPTPAFAFGNPLAKETSTAPAFSLTNVASTKPTTPSTGLAFGFGSPSQKPDSQPQAVSFKPPSDQAPMTWEKAGKAAQDKPALDDSANEEDIRGFAKAVRGLNHSLQTRVNQVLQGDCFADLSPLLEEYLRSQKELLAKHKQTVDKLKNTTHTAVQPPSQSPKTTQSTTAPMSFSFGGSTTFKFGAGPTSGTAAPPAFNLAQAPKPVTEAKETVATTNNDEENDGEEEGSQEPQRNPDDFMSGVGEEDEVTEHEVRNKLFKFEKGDNPRWDPVGLGVLKLKANKKSQKRRLLCRADGAGRVLLNAAVFSGMTVKKEDEKSVSFIVVIDGSPTKFLARVKTADDAKKLLTALETAAKK